MNKTWTKKKMKTSSQETSSNLITSTSKGNESFGNSNNEKIKSLKTKNVTFGKPKIIDVDNYKKYNSVLFSYEAEEESNNKYCNNNCKCFVY